MHKIIEKIIGLQFLKHDMRIWAMDEDGKLSGSPFRTHDGKLLGLFPGWSYVQKCNKCGYMRSSWLDKVITFSVPRRKRSKYLRGNTV